MLDEKSLLQQQRIDGLQLASTIGLIIFSMLFAALFLGLILMRDNYLTNWPPPSFSLLSRTKPILSTLCIFLSSLSLVGTQKYMLNAPKLKLARSLLNITILLGFCFLGVQYLFWKELNNHGFNVETGAFASFVHAMTWVHAAHILLGLAFLFVFKFRLTKRESEYISSNEVQKIKINFYTSFWHFLSLVWFLLLIGLFAPL